MPIPPARPPALRGRVFCGSSAVRDGLPSPEQLRSSAWRRLRQDVYAGATLPVTRRLLVSAVGLVLPVGAGFTGRSAAVLWGVPDIADADDPVEVVMSLGRRWNAGPGVRVRGLLPAQRPVQRGQWRCVSQTAAAVDLVRFGDRDEAIVLLDRVIQGGLTTLADVREAGGGLPAPVAQYRVVDAVGFVARVDFACPDLRIAIEYDGLRHGARAAFMDDRRRLNRLTAAGWVVLHVTADDLRCPERPLVRIRALRARRLSRANTR